MSRRSLSVSTLFRILAILCFSVGAFHTHAQVVENVVAEIVNNNRDAVIRYNLGSTGQEAYRVSLFYSTNNGLTFQQATENLSGDVGAGVAPGTGKLIHWKEFSYKMRDFRGGYAIFRVLATPGEGAFTIGFDERRTSATEGQGIAELKLTASQPFYGVVRYQISAMTNVNMGPVTNPDIAPLSGQVLMTGVDASIPVHIMDNFEVEVPKALTVDLIYDESLGYTVGTIFRHMLVLYDNDSTWNGTAKSFKLAEGEAPFQMILAQKDGQLSGSLVSKLATPTALSVLPAGVWPLDVSWDNEVFTARTRDAMPVPATLLFPDAGQLVRYFGLQADKALAGNRVDLDLMIMGNFTDEAVGESGCSYLDSVTSGGFVMVKNSAPFIPPSPEILPKPDALSSPMLLPSDAIVELKGDVVK